MQIENSVVPSTVLTFPRKKGTICLNQIISEEGSR